MVIFVKIVKTKSDQNTNLGGTCSRTPKQCAWQSDMQIRKIFPAPTPLSNPGDAPDLFQNVFITYYDLSACLAATNSCQFNDHMYVWPT